MAQQMEPKTKKISCGEGHTVLIADSGMGFACGEGTYGELGNERFRVTQNLDMIKAGSDNDGSDACGRKRIIHVACGAHHTLLITSDGFLYTFGDEAHGCLGHGPSGYYRATDGNKRSNNIPMLNRFLLSYDYDPTTKFDVRSLRLPIAATYASAGDGYSMIVDQAGVVWSWGRNIYGNLGVGDTTTRHFPTRVESLINKNEIVKEIHCGAEHVLAITVQGSCYTWGHGAGGRLGRGDVYDSTVPAYVSHLSTVFVLTGSAGDAHTAAISDNGQMFTWGSGSFGRLGLGDERDNFIPQLVTFPLGSNNSSDSNKNKSNGSKKEDDSNNGDKKSENKEDASASKHDPVVTVACGTTNTMAITQSGVMYSMGGGLYGKLGLGDQKNRTRPTKVVALSHENISDVACGSFHTMILTQSGVVYGCGFGGALNSRVGLGITAENQILLENKPKSHSRYLLPLPVVNMPPRAIMIEQQEMSSLGGVSPRHLLFTGDEYVAEKNVSSFGSEKDDDGSMSLEDLALNDPNAMDLISLTAVMPPSTVIQVSCGRHHSMFLTLGGRLFACGENECGQLGINSTDDIMIPKIITHNIGKERVAYVACGADHTLALTARGLGFSWGRGKQGQLGTGKNIDAQKIPSLITMTKKIGFSLIAGGEEYSGGIDKLNGFVYTWGTGNMGQLGHEMPTTKNKLNNNNEELEDDNNNDNDNDNNNNNNNNNSSCWTPRRVSTITEKVKDISLGMTHSAALTATGKLYTWGSGWYGKLGHGSLDNYWSRFKSVL